MTQELAAYLTSQALTTALIVSAPMLLAGMVVGIAVSIFQAVTQINEMRSEERREGKECRYRWAPNK